MSFSKKFILIIAIGFILLMPFSFTNFAVVVCIFYNLVCIVLLISDYLLSPNKNIFIIERAKEDKLYFKATNSISISIKNNYTKPMYVMIKDEIPSLVFKTISANKETIIFPNSESAFTYDVIPLKRGSFIFKNIHVKYRSNWGLCYKHFVISAPIDFKVYPNLKDLTKYRLLMLRHSLLPAGEKRIHKKGNGTEFESLREYVDGDDYRKINWMATSRENKLITNLYEIEKNQPVFIMIDTGRPMSYEINGFKKLDYAINAALILSDIVNQKGDNTGLCVFDTEVSATIMPKKGQEHRNTLMETLYHIASTKNTSDYEEAFTTIIRKQKRRSIVFIFTDFETSVEATDLVNNIKVLKKRHLPIVILMKNESVDKMARDTKQNLRSSYRKALALNFLNERKRLIRLLNMNGTICIESTAENFCIDSVNEYLQIKSKNTIV